MPPASAVDPPFRVEPPQARELADAYGTPLYVIGEDHFRARIRRYRAAFAASFPRTALSYASKANSTLAVLAIAYQEGCLIDVASEGELRAALLAGVPASACEFHGSNKAVDEIRFALEAGVRTVIVDNFEEIDELLGMRPLGPTEFVMRLAPGVDPITHEKISTGQEDSKFGFNISDGSAERALTSLLRAGVPVAGFHCHVGSQLHDPGAQIAGGEALANFMEAMYRQHGFEARVLNLGGGLGIRYTPRDAPRNVEEYCRQLASAMAPVILRSSLSPTLMQEPGRSLIGESGSTLYCVGVVKSVPLGTGTKTYVSVDGGLADNPRPALYGGEYAVERVCPEHSKPLKRVTVSGRHCETDLLFADVELPEDLRRGDLLQVLCTGAYNSSMASNYNRYPRPASVLLTSNGGHRLIQRREAWEDQFSREIPFGS